MRWGGRGRQAGRGCPCASPGALLLLLTGERFRAADCSEVKGLFERLGVAAKV